MWRKGELGGRRKITVEGQKSIGEIERGNGAGVKGTKWSGISTEAGGVRIEWREMDDG